MWPAFVASCLMVMSSGQLELNGPQNAVVVRDVAVPPGWKPGDKLSADQPADSAAAAQNYSPQPAAVANATAGETPARQRVPGDRPAVNYPPDSPTPQNAPPDQYAAPPSALPKPFVTRQTFFSLPAKTDAASSSASAASNGGMAGANAANGQIVEVQLFVSHDRGANWNFYTRVKPDQTRFTFRTANDGEYWFATRTLGRTGKFDPPTVNTPTIVVHIDTKPPIVQLSADAAAGGQVSSRWEISDPHLKPDTLTLQYRAQNSAAWQSVGINENSSSVTDNSMSGEATFWPTPGTQEVVLRAEVSDTLGNKAVAHAQVKLGQGGTASGALGRDARDIASRSPTADGAGMKAVTATANSRIGNKYPTDVAAALMSNPFLAYLPPDEKPRMVNSRVFELDYDLQSVGPSGVSRVELFGTRDGGRTWRSFGVDSDNRSPMTVRVDEEGLYGFQIVVTSGAGLGDPPPKSGDKPSIWIGVDLTRPTAKITSAAFGHGDSADKLIIAWEASDKMPTDKPVTLSYSTQPGGQYTAFAPNLENSGTYLWSIDGSVPPVVYLRLEVVDEAGNRTICDYPQPVVLDRSRPTGRIRDVRPAGM
jgi:hypothetical protein